MYSKDIFKEFNLYKDFDSENIYPEELDPYKVLKISYKATPKETKLAFRQQLVNTNRSSTCLAYDMICNKNNYIINSNNSKYKVKKKDQFYYTHVGGLEELKNFIEKKPSLINQKDNLGRSLLYLAARNGYIDICNYLLQKGAKINETQNTGSTPLHGASYYGNELVVQLLLQYGANTKIKNNFSNYAMNESKVSSISENIMKFGEDVINILLNKLNDSNLSNGMRLLKKKGIIVGKKIIRNISLQGIPNIGKDWILCWHGTHYNALESIMEKGLLVPGMKLKNGIELEPKDNHISRFKPVDEISDWAKAIFVSPSILYALDGTYSEKIYSEGERWGIILETKIKPNSYYSRGSTVRKYQFSKNEPKDVEYRIASEKDVVVTSIVFARCSYIDNNKDYLNLSSDFKNF